MSFNYQLVVDTVLSTPELRGQILDVRCSVNNNDSTIIGQDGQVISVRNSHPYLIVEVKINPVVPREVAVDMIARQLRHITPMTFGTQIDVELVNNRFNQSPRNYLDPRNNTPPMFVNEMKKMDADVLVSLMQEMLKQTMQVPSMFLEPPPEFLKMPVGEWILDDPVKDKEKEKPKEDKPNLPEPVVHVLTIDSLD